MIKEIVILAKSNKKNNYCIAGIDLKTGDWIRPVSNNFSVEGAVLREDALYEDGTSVDIFDIVKIDFKESKSTIAQPENYVYDPNFYWEKTGVSSLKKVIKERGYDQPNAIFYNHDKEVCKTELNGASSLLLLNVKNPKLVIKTFESKKIQLNFEYNEIPYSFFKISDPYILEKYQHKSDGTYNLGSCLDLVLSLTDEYKPTHKYYKMVAQIF